MAPTPQMWVYPSTATYQAAYRCVQQSLVARLSTVRRKPPQRALHPLGCECMIRYLLFEGHSQMRENHDNSQYSALLEASGQAIVGIDPGGAIVIVNAMTEQM